MEIVGAEARFMIALAARIRSGKSEGYRPFDELPPAVQRRILQQELLATGLVPDFELIEQLRSAAGKFVSANSNVSVARDAGGKILLRENSEKNFHPAALNIDLSGKIRTAEFGGQFFSWSLEAFHGSRGRSSHSKKMAIGSRQSAIHQEFFDADKIGGKIILRHWRAGDRFQPIGLKSAAKLQDLFVNAKIPAARRRELVLAVAAGGEIFWVEGLRIGEKFKLTPATRRQFRWNWSKIAV